MSNEIQPSSLVGKRKRKKDSNPNPLISKWLAEWRDEAKEKGWKSEYIYSKALVSLQKYPLPLSTGKECKILQHFGDKICKMLDDRFLKHKQEQENLSALRNFSSCFPSSSTSGTSHPKSPATVHEISDSSDDDSGASNNLNSAIVGKTSTVQTDNGISTIVGEEIAKQTMSSRNAANVVTVDYDDEEVSFLGRASPIKIDELDTSDDDLPVLPRLPDLDDGNREAKESPRKRCETDCAGDIDLAKTTAVARETHSISDSDGEEAGQLAAPQRPGRKARGRQPREYIPAYRSGPYAVLLTLFRQAQDPDFWGFMTKAELCRAAQPLADKSFTVPDPGSRYTVWSSVSVLIKKGFLTKETSPAKYRLTDQGHELAHRLEDVERRHAAGFLQDGGDGPDDGPGGDGITRKADMHGPLVTDDGTDTAHTTDRQTRRSPQKNKTKQKENSGSFATKTIDCSTGSSSSAESSKHNMVEVREEEPAGSENGDCVVVEDLGEDDDSDDDELPALTLPSLAERLRPSTSTAPSTSVETSRSRRLQFWYVAEGDKLVSRKDQASVLVDEAGVSFLVKVDYQHLLQSGSQYKLDMTRPLGDDYVFVYLSDNDCCEEAHPPPQASEHPAVPATTKPDSTAIMRSSITATKSRPVHEISDSDSEGEPVCSKSDVIPISSVKSTGMPGGSKLPAGVSSVSSAISNHKAKTTVKTTGASTSSALPEIPSLSSSQGSVDSMRSSAADPAVDDFVLLPGTFEIVLCVDNREFYGGNSRSKTLLPDLIKNQVNCDLRLLNVGDVLWVAREKVMGESQPVGMLGNTPPKRRELVLNYIVERKRMDDLVSSMISGRLKEQKFRLKHSGIQEKIILIEHYGSMQHFSISEDRIKQAIANTEIIDGFTVKQTQNSKETASYLTLMTRFLQSYFQDKTLRSGSRDTIKELGIKFHVRDKEQMLMPFDHFNQLSMKNKRLTLMELFGKQLIQLWGMSAEKARAIVEKYPTPSSLMKAYRDCTSEKEKESLLANVKYGKNHRNLGIVMSRQVAQLYTSKVLT